MSSPLISVIMPAFNARRTIGAAITGVLTQTYPNVELIVIDDGSTDGTAEIAAAYGDDVNLLQVENGGSARARNHGLAAAQGDWIAFCDSDDIFNPPHLQSLVDAWNEAGGGRRIVTTDAVMLTHGGTGHGRTIRRESVPSPAEQRRAILERNFVMVFSAFPRQLLDDVGGFDEDIRYNEDWDFWLRAIHSGWEIVDQPAPHVLYRVTPDSKTSNGAGEVAQDPVLRRALDNPELDLTADERAAIEFRLSVGNPYSLMAQAEDAMRRRDYAETRELALRVLSVAGADRKLRLKAMALGKVPGGPRVMGARLNRIDAELARGTKPEPGETVSGGASTPSERPSGGVESGKAQSREASSGEAQANGNANGVREANGSRKTSPAPAAPPATRAGGRHVARSRPQTRVSSGV